MDFDFATFEKQRFEPRKLRLALPHFGDTEETLVWHYTGLDSRGMAMVEEASLNDQKIERIAEAAAAVAAADVSQKQIKELLGIQEKTPASLLRRYAIFEEGSLPPNKPRSRRDTVKFANVYPLEFRKITDAIWTATAMGQAAKKKPSSSGEPEPSEETLPSEQGSESLCSD